MDEVIGSFYFRKTSSGNITGEFTNNLNNRIFTESADLNLVTQEISSFAGNYIATWQENEESHLSTLNISFLEGSNNLKYRLIWRSETSENILFHGEGFLVGDILIGHYTNTAFADTFGWQ